MGRGGIVDVVEVKLDDIYSLRADFIAALPQLLK